MDLQQKLGQRLVFGFQGTAIPPAFRELVRTYRIGNVILFRYNVESTAQLRALCAELQALVKEATGYPAFITIDQEGGMVTRLPADAVTVPGNMAIAATGEPDNARLTAQITARQLRGVGVNFNLAPDVDVNSNSANPAIGVRSFGDDPHIVSAYGAKAVQGYREGGVLCCGKHFPGHGDTAVDSHVGLPRVDKSMAELRATELVPFAGAIQAGIPAIMSTHILFPQVEPDGVPATMSRRIMHGLLREEMEFDGLILSDCMVMDAIQKFYGTANGVVAAMNAGVDMVFVCSNAALQRESAERVRQAAGDGALDLDTLDASVERILKAKQAYAFTGADDGLAGRKEDFETAEQLARRAVVHAGGEAFCADEQTFFCGCADYRMTQASNADPSALPFPLAMERIFGGTGMLCDTDPDEEQVRALAEAARSHPAIVLSACNAHLYRGQLALARALSALGRPLAVVALRNPYDLPLCPQGAYKLAAWDYSPAALGAVAQVLRGGACFGRLPVKLEE